MCKHPGWAIQKVQSKYINSNEDDKSNNNQEVNPTDDYNPSDSTQGRSTPRDKPSVGNIVIPYTQGLWTASRRSVGSIVSVIPYTQELGDSFKKICGRYSIHIHFKGSSTLNQLLVRTKDQDLKEKKSGVIYSYQCG